jgi:hypothetical protein
VRLIELRVANGIDRADAWRIFVPVSAITCIEQWATIDRADKNVARLTLTNGRVVWPTETYTALVERLRSGVDESFLAPADEA